MPTYDNNIKNEDLLHFMTKKHSDEIHREIMQDAITDMDSSKGMHSAVKMIIVLMFIFLLIMIVIPYYSISVNPKPKNIPTLSEIHVPIPNITQKFELKSKYSFLSIIEPSQPDVKRISVSIASKSCLYGRLCHAKAIYYFTRDNIKYVSDPRDGYVETALETLSAGGSDCDGMAVLLANMLESVGIHTRFVLIPNHIYVQAKLPKAPRKFRDEWGWVSLDATCKNCEFGEIPSADAMAKKEYIEKY